MLSVVVADAAGGVSSVPLYLRRENMHLSFFHALLFSFAFAFTFALSNREILQPLQQLQIQQMLLSNI